MRRTDKSLEVLRVCFTRSATLIWTKKHPESLYTLDRMHESNQRFKKMGMDNCKYFISDLASLMLSVTSYHLVCSGENVSLRWNLSYQLEHRWNALTIPSCTISSSFLILISDRSDYFEKVLNYDISSFFLWRNFQCWKARWLYTGLWQQGFFYVVIVNF